jgi:hypothetical protein
MDQWWSRNSDIRMEEDERRDVEDVTGCIPLLLDTCKVDGGIDLTVTNLRKVYDKAVSFVQQIRAKNAGDSVEWNWYVRLIQRSGHY